MPASGKTDIDILALYGSPRREGRSSRLHDAFLSPLEPIGAIARVHVYERSIKPCTGCGHCREKRECIFDDDMTQIYSQIENARLISISSPVYFSSLPAPLKALIDRCQLLWELYRREPDAGRKRTGFFISAAGSRYHHIFLPSVTIIRHFFNSIGVDYLEKDFLLCPDMERPEGVASFEQSLDSARELGLIYHQRLIANNYV